MIIFGIQDNDDDECGSDYLEFYVREEAAKAACDALNWERYESAIKVAKERYDNAVRLASIFAPLSPEQQREAKMEGAFWPSEQVISAYKKNADLSFEAWTQKYKHTKCVSYDEITVTE